MQNDYAGMNYEQVVHEYAQTVASVCYMRLNNHADAEDCFQTTFLKLYTSSPDFLTVDHLKAWLIRVAINECNSCLRARGRFLPLEAAAKVPVFLDESDASSIPALIMQLSPKYREVFYLYYCEGYPISEIASILNKNPNTIKTRLHRAREAFKKLYGGDGFE